MATTRAKIQIRRDTTANWQSNDPVLLLGEIGYDITVKAHKVGDGATHWNALEWQVPLTPVKQVFSDTYTILPSDNGKVIRFRSADPTTITVPPGLPIGLSVLCVQLEAVLTAAGGSGVTIINVDNQYSSTNIGSVLTLLCISEDTFILAGNTA